MSEQLIQGLTEAFGQLFGKLTQLIESEQGSVRLNRRPEQHVESYLPPAEPDLALIADRYIKFRRNRESHLPGIFADPAWDMLLDLFVADARDERISVSSVCIGAAVPATTALRHLDMLVNRGYVQREKDQTDGRRVWVRLTPIATNAMQNCLSNLAWLPDIPTPRRHYDENVARLR